ncbi:MAG TPA: TlpA family protein disulfide reductase [Candidatus Cryptobacteroides excrementigallinarum]|nr:TlpA family protein disulfide reductase [Candidatus Cryptobacteroides excrementigallinarum]
MNKIMSIAASLLLAVAVGCANVPEEQALEEYNTRTTALVEDFNSQVAALQADSTLSTEEMTAKMQEAYDAVSAELVSDGLEMIRKYPSGTLAVTALQNVASVMEENQLAEALGMLEGAALEDDYVKSLVALNNAKQATAEGKMFTDFTVVQDPADSLGSKVSLSDFVGKGKYVLVDFWASWCGPCKAEIPNIAAVYEKYKGEDFDVLSIAVWDDPADTKVSAKEHGVVWNQIINAQQVPTDLYGIEGIPHIILFGPDGTILKRNLRGEDIESAVAEALGR